MEYYAYDRYRFLAYIGLASKIGFSAVFQLAPHDSCLLYIHAISMFTVLVLFKVLWITMALLRVEHQSGLVFFPLGEDGHAIVTNTTLSLWFRFCHVTIFVKQEIFDDQIGLVSHVVCQTRGENDVGTFRLLKPGKYRVYGVLEFELECSTELLTTTESSTVSIKRPLLSRVKIELGIKTIYELSDDSDGDVEVLRSESKIQTSLSPEIFHKETTPHVIPSCNPSQAKVVASHVVSINDSLMCLEDRKRSKSVLSRINFDTIRL